MKITHEEKDKAKLHDVELGTVNETVDEHMRSGNRRWVVFVACAVVGSLAIASPWFVATNNQSKGKEDSSSTLSRRKFEGFTDFFPSGQQHMGYECGTLARGDHKLPACQKLGEEEASRVVYYRYTEPADPFLGKPEREEMYRLESNPSSSFYVETITKVDQCLPSCADVNGKLVNEKCIYIPWNENGPETRWHSHAESYCVSDTGGFGRIAVIESEQENNALYQVIEESGTKEVLYQDNDLNGVWLGATRHFRSAGTQEFRWYNFRWVEDGYTAWNTNEPNNYEGTEYCMEMLRWGARWNDDDCHKKQAFACERAERPSGEECDIIDFVFSLEDETA